MAGFDVSGSGGGAGSAAAPTIRALGNLGATETIAMTGESNVWCSGTLDASCAITVTGLSSGDRLTLFLAQDATGGRTLSINDGSGAVSLAIPSAASSTMKIELEYDGTDSYIDVAGGVSETVIRKAADETVNNSATLQNDDHLVLPVAANETWQFELWLLLSSSSGSAADWKFGWTVPASTTMFWGSPSANAATNQFVTVGVAATPVALTSESGTVTSGSDAVTNGVILRGWIRVAGTAGNVQFQWAQNTATAVDNKVLKDSVLIARRIATS